MPELNRILDDFEKEDDPRRGLRRLLDQVPSLKHDLEAAAHDGNLIAIRYADIGATNGTYDYRTKTLTLNHALRSGVDVQDPDSIIALAYVAGHEGNHATRGDISLAHTAQLKHDVEQAYAHGQGVRDYTVLAARHVDYLLREEALAEIGGFNAAVTATKWVVRSDDYSDTLQALAEKGPGGLVEGPAALALGQLSQYIEGVQGRFGTDYQLKGGMQPGEDGLLNPANGEHLQFMEKNFSDRRHDDPSLDRYYRHVAAADVVRLAIGAGSQHVDIGIGMDALGVRAECFVGKFSGPDGKVVAVGFTDVKSAQSPHIVEQQPPVHEDDSRFAGRKRARASSSQDDDGGIVGDRKLLKPSLNESLLLQARECLKSEDCLQEMASRGVGAQADRLAVAAAVKAQNAGFDKVGDIAIAEDGRVWVLSESRGHDFAKRELVGYDKTLARCSEEQHLEKLSAPRVENIAPPEVGAQNIGVNPKQM